MTLTALGRSAVTVAALTFADLGATLHDGSALAAEPPQLKEGLWSIHSQNTDAPSEKKTDFRSVLCRSHASDWRTRENARDAKECATVSENLQANKYTIQSRCRIKGSVVETRSTTLFMENATHTEVHVTYTPALNGITASTLIEDQKYLGKCPSGAESGDLMLPNGTVQHLGRADADSPSRP